MRLLIIVSLLTSLLVSMAWGHSPYFETSIKITETQSRDFFIASDAIATQGKFAILAEDAPLYSHLASEEVKSFSDTPLPADEMVERFATAYDYKVWMVTRGGRSHRPQEKVYILKKRYSNPRDLPCVTVEECRNAVRDIRRMLASQEPQPPVTTQTELVQTIWHTLSPEQRQAIQQPAGIPVIALASTQREQMRRLVMYAYIWPLTAKADNALFYLNQFETIKAREADSLIPGFAKSASGRTLAIEVTDSYRRRYLEPVWGEPNNEERTFPGYTPIIDIKKIRRGKITLEEGITTLNQTVSAKNKTNGASYAVAASLARKRVTLSGAEYAPENQIFEALAEVYGLRVTQFTNTAPRQISEWSTSIASTHVDVVPLMRRRLPEPLRRAMHEGRQHEIRNEIRRLNEQIHEITQGRNLDIPFDIETANVIRKINTQQEILTQESSKIRGYWSFMRGELSRQSLASVMDCQRKKEQNSSGTSQPVDIAFTELDSITRDSLALLFLMPLLHEYTDLAEHGDVPLFVSQFDQMHLIGAVTENNGKSFIAVRLGKSQPNTGKVQPLVGISGIEMPKE
jgi:hypothetical protein